MPIQTSSPTTYLLGLQIPLVSDEHLGVGKGVIAGEKEDVFAHEHVVCRW